MRPFVSLIAAGVLALLSCQTIGIVPPSTAPITSAGDPTAPVPFEWTVHESHRPDGHRLQLQGGTLHAIASEVRLLDPAGRVVAAAPASPLAEADAGLCGGERRGMVQAELPLPAAHLDAFRQAAGQDAWSAGYRAEALVGANWRPIQPTFAGCVSIE